MTDVQALSAAIVALAGAVGTLWVQVSRATKRLERKLDDCEQDRANLWKQLRICSPTR